ncbi:hypothetical protein [Polaribacter cellanae]|uniref:DUF3575 domain-containing protein n=1 Tax=Polaribacter cellanae TaxID=2818493 RepID=A0A975CLJ2_9FLAO|nr:hypothetical protein [Polaribacter cellanae]QTE21445.1 hypothetical protein J3359_11490 [Polaribacter cellanae]
MQKKTLFTFFLSMLFFTVFSQQKQDSIKIKTNPIIFTGMNLGFTSAELRGFNLGFNVNYQQKNNLFTLKYTAILEEEDFGYLIPFFNANSVTSQFSLLYGKRYIEDNFSYHFSGGISYSHTNDRKINKRYQYFGFPIEIGVNWFKSKKKRLGLLYGLIPVGKPTGFGRSFGIKLYANIAKKSYVGLGLNFGIGWHKKY